MRSASAIRSWRPFGRKSRASTRSAPAASRICSTSKAHRNDVATLRQKVDEVLGCVSETESRLAEIESRKKLVDEVQLKTTVITNMLEDVRLNLETLGEQKAVVDHVMESVTRLSERTQEAQTTLKALQTERELAERIARGIKQLRKTAPAADKQKLA